MGKDDLQMTYLFVIIFTKISLHFHAVGVFFESVLEYIHSFWGDFILVSALGFFFFLPDTHLLWVCLEHFISPMRAVHGKHRVMEQRGEKSIFKKEDFFLVFISSMLAWA